MAEISGSNSNHWKVLVVDDEPDIVEELCEFLRSEGYPTVGATTVAQGQQIFAEDPGIGMVFADLRMPGQDGLTFIGELMQRYRSRLFETVLLTGHGGEEDVVRGLRLGLSDYLRKPVDFDALLDTIARLEKSLDARLGRRSMAADLRSRIDALSSSLGEEPSSGRDDVRADYPPRQIWPARSSSADEGARADDGEARMPAFAEKLTNRQKEVLHLIAKGMNNAQIAHTLGISENTVKLHVSHILRTANMNNRTQLALAMVRTGQGA